MKLGIQLFSVRNEAEADFEGTIKTLSEIGYDGVELAGTYGLSFDEIRNILQKYGMKAPSAHIGAGDVNTPEIMNGYKSLGLSFAALNGFGIGDTVEKVNSCIGYATDLGIKSKEHDIQLMYHNHSYEFNKINGEYAIQLMYDGLDSDIFKCEVDVAWVYEAGADPVEFINRNKNIIPIVHIKDYIGVHGEDSFKFMPAGQGNVGIERIVEAAKNSIAEWLIVEQDQPTPGKTSLECAAESAKYLKKLLGKKDLQENIISAVNQNKKDTYFHGDGKFKVMFVGNSITKHEPKPEVGWTNDCGMAASSIEKDYVHLLIKKFEDYFGKEISWTIVQVANFERNFDPERISKLYSSAKDFNPDVMVMFFGANVPKEYDTAGNPPFKFGESYEKIRNYLSGDNTKVFHSQGFYIRPVLDKEKEAVANKLGDYFINIEDIRNREDTHGLFNHPGDLGMAEIAERFWKVIEPTLP